MRCSLLTAFQNHTERDSPLSFPTNKAPHARVSWAISVNMNATSTCKQVSDTRDFHGQQFSIRWVHMLFIEPMKSAIQTELARASQWHPRLPLEDIASYERGRLVCFFGPGTKASLPAEWASRPCSGGRSIAHYISVAEAGCCVHSVRST